MSMKNRKGSTLVMTLMVFAVLMIFGTVTLNLMVNENKMSVNHQEKTQAYYIARSGAVAVEAAIMNQLTSVEKDMLINMSEDEVKEVGVKHTDHEGVLVEIPVVILKKSDTLEITSIGTVNKITEIVTKVLSIKAGKSIPIENNFIVLSKRDSDENNIPIFLEEGKHLMTNAGKDKIYESYDFNGLEVTLDSPIKEIPTNNELGKENSVTDYIVDNLNINGNIEIYGKVNIYVKENVKIESAVSTNINKDNFNIYIFNNNKENTERLSYKAKNINNGNSKDSFKSNIYIVSGIANINLQNSNFDSNIISNGLRVNLDAKTGGVDNEIINGNIYAPNAMVEMNIKSLQLNGYIVSNYLNIHKQNDKDFDKEEKLVLEQGVNQELEMDGNFEIKSGYFK